MTIKLYNFQWGEFIYKAEVEAVSFEEWAESVGYDVKNEVRLGETLTEIQARIYPGCRGVDNFLLQVIVGELGSGVFCRSLPDLMMFLGQITPIITLSMRTQDREEWNVHLLMHEDAPQKGCSWCAERRDGQRRDTRFPVPWRRPSV